MNMDTTLKGECEWLVVIVFTSQASEESIEWLRQRISDKREENGAELIVKYVRHINDEKDSVFLVTSSVERLLLAAEVMEMKRRDHKHNLMMEFQIKNLEDFVRPGEDVNDLFTSGEKQRIIFHELESIRATVRDQHVPGHAKLNLYPGKPLLHKYKNNGLISQVFPLHDRSKLKVLGEDWYKHFLHKQPIGDIRSYFGEHIAIYFAFLGSYAVALIPPALLGVFYYISSWDDMEKYTTFSIFNVVWVTVFLEVWKRNCSELAFIWGTLGTQSALEEPRAAFKGTMAISEITGKEEPQYPAWKRQVKKYCVSLPIVILCLAIATGIMLGYVQAEWWVADYHKLTGSTFTSILMFTPSIIYTVIIVALNSVYRMAMTKLTEWENHRVQSAHMNSLIVKLVVFEFVNCFGGLFFVAFYEQNMEKLRRHLAALLITTQLIDQCVETAMPYLLSKYKKRKIRAAQAADVLKEGLSVENQAQIELNLDEYPGTFFDYLELFLQFGYVFLFSSVFPLAAMWALLNNILEIRSDAFKLCRAVKRPFSEPSANIGVWQIVFEIMGVIAVITNCSLIALSPSVRKQISQIIGPESTELQIFLLFVFAEHILIGIKCVIAFVIPDEPDWVGKAVARTDYLSRQAFKEKKASEAKKEIALRTSHHS